MLNSYLQHRVYDWLLRETNKLGVRRVSPLGGAIASDVGNVRKNNQDKAAIIRAHNRSGAPYALVLLADGMGGMEEGEACAALTIAAIISSVERDLRDCGASELDTLNRAVRYANQEVFLRYRSTGGSTIVCAILSQDNKVAWASAGDSRIYLSGTSELQQITVDDTLAGQMKRRGPVPREHTKLIQYVGMGEHFEPHVGWLNYLDGEQLVLASDGVHYLAEAGACFQQVVTNAQESGVAAKRLVEVASWCGGEDNASVAIIRLPVRIDASVLEAGSLQLWDSFGELDIQTTHQNPSIGDNGHGKYPYERHTSPSPDNGDTVATASLNKRGAAKPRKSPPGPRKQKPKSDEENQVPQLNIKFSDKDKS